jgi:hypothetical protein
MRFYIAGKARGGETTLTDIKIKLESKGHRCLYDWARGGVRKPYLDHRNTNLEPATMMHYAATHCQAFILVWHPSLLGALIELGMAFGNIGNDELASGKTNRRVYVLEDPSEPLRQSIFYVFPIVHICHDDEDLYAAVEADFPPEDGHG